jgi:hypothetical protein
VVNNERVSDLLFQALQAEQDGARVYETAIRCAVREPLKEDWARYLSETREHEQALLEVFEEMGLDPGTSTPGREVARGIGRSLVEAMEQALRGGPSETAELVASECVVHAETRDQLNWELLGHVSRRLKGDEAEALARVHRDVEEEAAEHLGRSRGWARELWLESLGLSAPASSTRREKR